MESPHIPVLLQEIIESFKTDSSGYFIDATLGYGGHSEAVLENSPNLHLIGIDRDITAIEFSRKRLERFGDRVTIYHGSFGETIGRVLENHRDKPIFGLLADIGVSSLQLDQRDRGFSFESENLDMRMDQSRGLTGYDVVNSYSEHQLSEIFREYGEMRNGKKVARAVVNQRPISSGIKLSEIISSVEKRKKGGTHPATLPFQAIRIEVNGELDQLHSLLDGVEALSGAKIGVISFHSLEDKIVKNRFRDWSKSCICPPEAFRCECGNSNEKGRVITKKPIVATQSETRQNPRSRSAKLRLFQNY
jgi:16S rRNA (cytosine1402-N4)-methyltransferase